jgi:DNA-binding transcriptional MerR regulator
MSKEKPKDITEYMKWLKEEHKVEILDRTKTHYETVTRKIKTDFEKSTFWNHIVENLKEWEGEYQIQKGYLLLAPNFGPTLDTKPFDSFLIKTFRKNVRENKRWPNDPEDGWIFPNNWYYRINDIIRTLLVVKYIDAVDFILNKLKELCQQHSAECKISLEAREEGYYAAHLYTRHNFEIPKITWDTEIVSFSIEIQITTQLQEVIRRLLHKYYEQRRKKIDKEDVKWQWNYKSDEFVANYLGHILHYVEGMIIGIRDKQKEEIT